MECPNLKRPLEQVGDAQQPSKTAKLSLARGASDTHPLLPQRHHSVTDASGPRPTCLSADEAATIKLQLLEAAEGFWARRRACSLFMEVDLAKVDPASLVGRTIRVLWPDDEAWYLATVNDFDVASGRHKASAVTQERRCQRGCRRFRDEAGASPKLPGGRGNCSAARAVGRVEGPRSAATATQHASAPAAPWAMRALPSPPPPSPCYRSTTQTVMWSRCICQ